MLFERGLWAQLQVLAGDRGAQKVARQRRLGARAVTFEGGALDIDTNADYEKLMASLG